MLGLSGMSSVACDWPDCRFSKRSTSLTLVFSLQSTSVRSGTFCAYGSLLTLKMSCFSVRLGLAKHIWLSALVWPHFRLVCLSCFTQWLIYLTRLPRIPERGA